MNYKPEILKYKRKIIFLMMLTHYAHSFGEQFKYHELPLFQKWYGEMVDGVSMSFETLYRANEEFVNAFPRTTKWQLPPWLIEFFKRYEYQ